MVVVYGVKMAAATIYSRVELHDADGEDYEELHRQMKERGFKRSVKSNDGKKYKLPTGTYRSGDFETVQKAHQAAREAAHATGKKSWIITIESKRATFHLEEA